jgi:hypothetical protein
MNNRLDLRLKNFHNKGAALFAMPPQANYPLICSLKVLQPDNSR